TIIPVVWRRPPPFLCILAKKGYKRLHLPSGIFTIPPSGCYRDRLAPCRQIAALSIHPTCSLNRGILMRKRGNWNKWFRSLLNPASSSRRHVALSRRVQLERLEGRYMLTAPVAVNDQYFPTYHDVPESSGPLFVMQNDTWTFPSLIKITEVNGTT